MLSLTPIVFATKSIKTEEENKLIIYGLILEIGLLVQREYDFTNIESPAFIVEDIIKTGCTGDKYNDLPFVFNDWNQGNIDQGWLLKKVFEKDAGRLKNQQIEYPISVFATIASVYSGVPAFDDFINSEVKRKEFRILRNAMADDYQFRQNMLLHKQLTKQSNKAS